MGMMSGNVLLRFIPREARAQGTSAPHHRTNTPQQNRKFQYLGEGLQRAVGLGPGTDRAGT